MCIMDVEKAFDRVPTVAFMVCGVLLYGRRITLKLKGTVYKSYLRLAVLYGSEAWCLNEGETDSEITTRARCGVWLIGKKILNDYIYYQSMVNSFVAGNVFLFFMSYDNRDY